MGKPLTLVALLAPSVAVAQLPVNITIESNQPSYRVSQTPEITITGTPGHVAILMVSAKASPTMLPGIGKFCFDPFAGTTLLQQIGTFPVKRGKLDANTVFIVKIDGVTTKYTVHTSGSKPIDVGYVFGPYMITKLIDVNRVEGSPTDDGLTPGFMDPGVSRPPHGCLPARGVDRRPSWAKCPATQSSSAQTQPGHDGAVEDIVPGDTVGK